MPVPDDPAGSCDVSDACDELGIAVARSGALHPAWPDSPALAGPVTTVRLEPASGTPTPLAALLDVLAGARGRVLLVDLGGRTDVQCWGGVLAAAALHWGVRGVLVDGGVRDVAALRALGAPVYARGVYPGGMRGRLRLAAAGEPVSLDGARVEPGSYAVADASGAVVVPAARLDEILALAARIRASEEESLRAVAAGADPRRILRAFGAEEPEPGRGDR